MIHLTPSLPPGQLQAALALMEQRLGSGYTTEARLRRQAQDGQILTAFCGATLAGISIIQPDRGPPRRRPTAPAPSPPDLAHRNRRRPPRL